MEQYTYREAVEQFFHITGPSGYLSDDFVMSKKAMATVLTQKRASLIKMLEGDAYRFSERMVQHLTCIEMERVDQQECPCAPATGCYWLKSKQPIPVPLIVQYVGDTLGHDRFEFVSWQNAKYIKDGRLPSSRHARYYTFKSAGEGKVFVFVYNSTLLPSITIPAIFENPIDAAAFPSCGKENIQAKCYPLDVGLHLDPAYVDTVFNTIVRELWPLKQRTDDDRQNNDKPAIQGSPSKN